MLAEGLYGHMSDFQRIGGVSAVRSSIKDSASTYSCGNCDVEHMPCTFSRSEGIFSDGGGISVVIKVGLHAESVFYGFHHIVVLEWKVRGCNDGPLFRIQRSRSADSYGSYFFTADS